MQFKKEPVLVDYCVEAMELQLSKLPPQNIDVIVVNLARLIKGEINTLEITMNKYDEKGKIEQVKVPAMSFLRTDIIKKELMSLNIPEDSINRYINGNSGCVELSNLTYILDTTIPAEKPEENENGTRGFMPSNYNLFSLQSRGFYLSDGADTMPIKKTHGGVFALVDAYNTNLGPKGMGGDGTSFTNKLKISPVKQEDINIYYDNNTLVIN